MKVLDHRKHVLADKPFALNVQDAQKIVEKAKLELTPNGKLAFLDFETRLTPGVQRMRSVIRSKKIGDARVLSFRGLMNGGFAADNAKFTHWSARESGGGIFSAVGTHLVDTCRYILADEVECVSAIEDPLVQYQTNAETGSAQRVTAGFYVSVQMKMKKGTHVTMVLSARSPGLPAENMVVVMCDSGTMTFDYMTSEYKLYNSKGKKDGPEELLCNYGSAFSDVGTPLLFDAIRSRILYGENEPDPDMKSLAKEIATFEDGLEVQKVTDAVHLSSEKDGEWIQV